MKARAKEAFSINLYSEKFIRILQMLETQLKEIKKKILYFTTFSCVSPLWYHHVAMTAITFLSSISSGHDHVILLYLHTSLLFIFS